MLSNDTIEIVNDVVPLEKAVKRLQAFADSQNQPLAPGRAGPPLNYADVRSVLREIAVSSAA